MAFRRENPTVQQRDFVIADGLRGPGRFLGCVVGVRVIDAGNWYGEGEVKVYRDGDTDLPDHLRHRPRGLRRHGLGHGRAHARPTAARRSVRGRHGTAAEGMRPSPTSSASTAGTCRTRSCSRRDLRVTIQQIGATFFAPGQEEQLAAYERDQPGGRRRAGAPTGRPALLAWGICERVDDYCATSFVYCREPQPVPAVDVAAATADVGRLDYEQTR